MGREDKTQITLGIKKDENGSKILETVFVWRTQAHVWYEQQNAIFYKLITSESEPVDMGDAESGHPGPFILSATGRARESFSLALGTYTITGKEHCGRPVYKKEIRIARYMFSMEDGAWAVDVDIGESKPVMKSSTSAICPTLCQHWQYSSNSTGGAPWIYGDITVKYK